MQNCTHARMHQACIPLTFVHLCILALSFSVVPTAEAAVDDYLGKTVTSVRLVIEGRDLTDPAIAQIVETRAGRPLRMADVRQSIAHLFSLGRFEDVRVDASASGGGVAVVYMLRPVHAVSKIELDGNLSAPGVDRSQLRRALLDRFGASPPLSRATDMARTIADALRARGYLHATVSERATLEHKAERATLVFSVDPGSRTRVGAVDVIGASGVSQPELLSELGLAVGGAYQPDELAARIDRYIASRRARGNYGASIVPTVRLSDNDRVASLTLTVNPGPRVRVVFEGDSLPADRRAELVPIEREGSADEDLLEDSTNRIEDELRAQGYREAKATHTREESNGELVITFNVRRGRLSRLNSVEISGNASVPLADLQSALRLRAGQGFSEARLDADIAGIEDLYHRRGFTAARAQAEIETVSAESPSSPGAITLHLAIREGVRTTVGAVRLEGNASVPEATLRAGLGLQRGSAYFEPQVRADADALQTIYTNLGYQNATVTASPNFSADRSEANPVFTIREGPRLIVDHVLIVGNVRTSTGTIERELQLKVGDPLSPAAASESQRRLAALGLFRRIRITEVRHGEETRRDVVVTVEEAPATTVDYGGGFEVRLRVVRSQENPDVATERIEVAPRASFGIGRRNLFGKNRSVNLFSSLSLHPRGTPEGGYGFSEYQVTGTYREPRLLNTAADAIVTATLQHQIRSSFKFARRGVNAEVARRLTAASSLSGSYQLQYTEVFDNNVNPADQHLVDRIFPQVRLSSVSSSAIRDTRDDALDPGHGEYVSINAQLAARRLGSEVGFAKTFMTAQMFRVAPRTRRLVLAGSAKLGLANAFPRTIPGAAEVVEDLPASERFFAGGDSSVRGYALDTLGTSATKDQDGFPIGGNAVVIFNAEARVPVWGGLGMVGFVDTGNVFARPTDLDLGALKTAAGFGVRYKSPLGPIRIDLGFKLHRDEISPGVREGLTALHISFGQAF